MILSIILILFSFIYEFKADFVLCPSSVTVCQNSGICVVVNDFQIFCRCPNGFEGMFLNIKLSNF